MVDIEKLRALFALVCQPEPDFDCSDFQAANWRVNIQSTREKILESVPALLDELTTLRAAQQWRGIESAPMSGVYRDDGSRIWDAADAINIVRMIDLLRKDEGNYVIIVSDNADTNGQPDRIIICNGGWTDWKERTFEHDDLRECLRMAVDARAAKAAEGK